MTQGAENDLLDIRFYQEATPVQGTIAGGPDNEPITDINLNTLTVDNKAIFARNTADQVTLDLSNHIGAVGPGEHASATTTLDGFLSAADKLKLDSVQARAQINFISPNDELSLVSRKDTILHLHPIATSQDGFMSAVDKVRLNGIEAGAQVNNITLADAAILSGAGFADALHTHDHSPGSETFTEAVHFATSHVGVTGVPGFPGFATAESFFISNIVGDDTIEIFSHTYSFAPEIIATDFRSRFIRDWDFSENFIIEDVQISGFNGIVTHGQVPALGGGFSTNSVWQGAFG